MKLNFQTHFNEATTQPTLVFIHGLFGSLSNLGMLARAFQEKYSIIQIDVRNHGLSPHSSEINYTSMAQDILDTLDELNIKKYSIIGHSMGGKIAMKVADLAPEKVVQMIILDMAPVTYHTRHHDHIFQALFAVQNTTLTSRQEAIVIMREYINEEMVIQFLLKSFYQGQWRFNVNAIYENYENILNWQTISTDVNTLFIRGSVSPYISKPEHLQAIKTQFSNAQLHEVIGAGHWLHAEKTAEVIVKIQEFLA